MTDTKVMHCFTCGSAMLHYQWKLGFDPSTGEKILIDDWECPKFRNTLWNALFGNHPTIPDRYQFQLMIMELKSNDRH